MEKINWFNSCSLGILFFCVYAYVVTENSASWHKLVIRAPLAQKTFPTQLCGPSSLGCVCPEPPCKSKEQFSYSTLHAGRWQSSTPLQVNLQSVSDLHQFKTEDFHSGIQSCIQSHSSRANTDNIATIKFFRDNTLHTLEIELSCYSYRFLKLEIHLGCIHYSHLQTCNELSFEDCHSYGKHQSHLKVQLGMMQRARMSWTDQVRHEVVCPHLDEA